MSGIREPYNANGDVESIANDAASDGGTSYADSPADGYFTARSHPRDVFVPNPSMAENSRASEDTKEHSSSSATGQDYSQLSSPATSLRSRLSVESLPILDAGPAPPDYAAATANRTEARSSDYDRRIDELRVGNRINYGSIPGVDRPPGIDSEEQQSGQHWPFGDVENPFRAGFPFVNNQGNPFGPGFPSNQSQRARDHESGLPNQPDLERQDMSDPMYLHDDSHEDAELLRWNRKSPLKQKPWYRNFTQISCINILIAVAITIIVVFVVRSTMSGRSSSSKPSNGHDNNDKNPGGSDGNDLYTPPTRPGRPIPPQASPSFCSFDYYTATRGFQFHNPSSFSFTEAMERVESYQGKIGGKVHVRRAQDDQEPDIMVYISVATSAPWKVTGYDIVRTDTALLFYLPDLQKDGTGGSNKPCLEVFAWIDVRKGVSLDELNLDTTHLDIIIDEDVFAKSSEDYHDPWLQVKGLANLGSISGDIRSGYWSSRETIVRTVSGDIKGKFSLLDKLGVFSSSGTVAIDVNPQEAAKDGPIAAEFIAETVSGDLTVTFPSSGEIPERMYNNKVTTISADISGSYILGHETIFHTTSGHVRVDLLPYHLPDVDSTLQTSATSADIDVKLLSPYGLAGEPWRQLQHSGSTTSGQFRIIYPSEWEGSIDVTTLTGDIYVKGKGVRIVTDDRKFSQHHVVAEKGSGSGHTALRSVTGKVGIRVGG